MLIRGKCDSQVVKKASWAVLNPYDRTTAMGNQIMFKRKSTAITPSVILKILLYHLA